MQKMHANKNNISSTIIVIFIGFMVLVYGRGTSFDVEAAEKRLSNDTNNWKSIFAITSLVILYILRKTSSFFQDKKIANIKLWGIYFISLLFISLFRENQLLDGVLFFFKTFIPYLVVYQIILFAYQKPVKILHQQLTIVFFIIGILCVYIHIQQGHKLIFFPDRLYDNLNRLGGLFYYANTAMLLGITFLLSYILLYEKFSYFYLLIAAISFILLIATDCRSIWIGVVMCVFFFHFRKISFALLLLFSVILFITINFSNFKFGNLSNISESNSDIFVRLAIWDFSLKYITANPILGYGSESPLSKGVSSMEFLHLDDPHNSIFGLCLQSGVIIAALYILIFLSNTRTGIKVNNRYRFLFFFWLFIPFFWGHLYESASGFINFILLFSIYALALHPDILNNKEETIFKVKNYLNKTSKKRKPHSQLPSF